MIGPYIIPKGFHPVSAYVWIAANYIFKKEVQIQIEHHAVLSHPEDILSMLTACCKDKDGQGMYEMHEAAYQPRCKLREQVCTYSTDHFCSNCLAKKKEEIPDAIVIYHNYVAQIVLMFILFNFTHLFLSYQATIIYLSYEKYSKPSLCYIFIASYKKFLFT